MSDEQWLDLIRRTQSARDAYDHLLELAEAEYRDRYGNVPSNVDDDYWIDLLHQPSGGSVDIDAVKKSASFFARLSAEPTEGGEA